MAGKHCGGATGELANNREAKAFCEGRVARTLATSPTNPHPSGSRIADAWDRGVAAKAAESTADDNIGCCAPCGAAAV